MHARRLSSLLDSPSYFNTVGSKEGWAPKAFVSSRSNRNKDQSNAAAQRPEDFMDEEDLVQAAETRLLETADSVAAIGIAGNAGRTNDGFFGLFVTEEETMGVKVVQQMGWRRDQGVGRKVRRYASLDDGTATSKDASSQHLFAPKDARSMPSAREEIHRKGLGYQSEARLGRAEQDDTDPGPSLAFSFLEPRNSQASKKVAPKKSSFGVGILNDTGSDDDDPYELGPKITFNKTLGKEKKVKKPSKFVKPTVAEKLVYVPKKAMKPSTSLSRTFQDQHLSLKGFILAIRTTDSSKPKYPPPQIPQGWKSSKTIATEPGVQDFQSVADAAKSSTLDATARASLLGETPLPSRSIFDFIPKEARDRLATLTGNSHLPQGLGQSVPNGNQLSDKAPPPKDLWSFVPVLDKTTAAGALAKGATGWMPYAEDPKKRARYIGFLELRAGSKQDLPERGSDMSVSDWAKELGEFAHAAQVFKPTSGIMASRFTSSKSSSQSGVENGPPGENLLRHPTTKIEDPADQAAKMGMYGPLTRSNLPFHPTRLLCKRFNVEPPPDNPHSADFSPGDFDTKAKTEEAVSKSDLDKMMREVSTRGPATQRPAWMAYDSVPAQATEHATVDVEANEALSKERASEDVFKAIFGDDDEE
ncbi:hypothetical protein K505DRAFT_325498 [Melanomma pulvis-pyrius CBS 109.77]|uniref:G-patch domain-containing protein n=1 Tax=Melanomma pulvis-pyrius CBS 109.77 TaxID=1314802 RepID=A0A6A6XB15_9PLEO|nr:hypothetical protein K505DRAFT_325498 [Melanomma pulvis-pyrius CBS 109.77]